MVSQVQHSLPSYFPPWLDLLIAQFGLDVALDLTADLTKNWTGQWFFDELRGLSDGAEVDYQTLLRIHMLAGLTQGKCSMFGAWGSALEQEGLIQLRALDWDMDGPFRDYSQITVYHPSNGNGNSFVNIGFTGFIGGLTGMSQAKLGISEIGVSYPDSSFGTESRVGVPFVFILRDILQWDQTIDDAISRMINERRTCDLILGVGDGKLKQFRGMQYSYSVLNIFDDINLRPKNSTWHPVIADVVYWGMDWLCPSFNSLLSSLLIKYHGQINIPLAIQKISAVEQSGDNHVAYYDLVDMTLFVSFASARGEGGPPSAYQRQYTKWNLTALFDLKL